MKNLLKLTAWLPILLFSFALTAAFDSNFFVTLIVVTVLSFFVNLPKNALGVVVSNPLIGKAKQSMGGATFTTWKGINVLKDKATSVANPKTGNQLMRRSALRQVVEYFRQNPGAIKAGYKKLAVKMSEYNAFASDALRHAFDYTAPPVATFDPTLLKVSKGTIAATPISTTILSRASNNIVATFPTTAVQPGQSVNDLAIISAFNITQNLSTGAITSAARSTGTATIPMPAGWIATDAVQVYLGFSNPLSGDSSDSETVATVIAA